MFGVKIKLKRFFHLTNTMCSMLAIIIVLVLKNYFSAGVHINHCQALKKKKTGTLTLPRPIESRHEAQTSVYF